MLETKDWVSGIIGFFVFSFGLLPVLSKMGVGPEWFQLKWFPVQIMGYIIVAAGFYLIVNSITEITNSNIIGWWSFGMATAITAMGVLNVLGQWEKVTGFWAMAWITPAVFHVMFIIQGFFLMIATVAMKL